jgi:RNA polymerase sigma factor (sigma-70 family)
MVPITAMWDLQCSAPSPEERLLWEEEVAGLLAAMTELSSGDREIIGLCYGSELSIAEAGEILGLSKAATRTRLWRALGRLRKILRQ